MSDALLKTPLYDLHVELGAKMVPFAGYSMPVQFPAGVLKEHLQTRNAAGLFDVSHMGQVLVKGDNPAKSMETLVPIDVIDLPAGKQRYALFTDAKAGILDDLMITNAGDHLYVVVNAACKEQDIAHMRKNLTDCELTEMNEHALLALQGPAAGAVMKKLCPDTANMVFMDSGIFNVDGIECRLSRSGYSGEDGFEISVAAADADRLARKLLAEPEVEAIGLGARDSLRLEAGLCLYGHDLDTNTTPIEASLIWAISKIRRPDGARAGGYPGADIVAKQIADGVSKKRVGILPEGRAPVREGTKLVDADGKECGEITSGGFGPSFGSPMAMGYVDFAYSKLETALFAEVRGKKIPVRVARMPFVQQRYYRG